MACTSIVFHPDKRVITDGSQGSVGLSVSWKVLGRHNANSVRKDLSSLPRMLDDTYNRIVLAIPESVVEFARHALMWLAFSMRPLTVNDSELAEAIIIKPGTRTVNLDDRFPEAR
jgi:hypothetical protein